MGHLESWRVSGRSIEKAAAKKGETRNSCKRGFVGEQEEEEEEGGERNRIERERESGLVWFPRSLLPRLTPRKSPWLGLLSGQTK